MFGYEWVQIGWFALILLAAVLGSVGIVYSVKLLRIKLGADRFKTLRDYALELVKWAEQIGESKGWSNEQKRLQVEKELERLANEIGIPITFEMLDFVIEAAVITIKKLSQVVLQEE